MSSYYLTPSAVILMLMRERNGETEVLLQRRKNTGFADGLWDFSCSGKVEEGETMTSAAVREAKEELGISLSSDKLQFAVLIHKCDKPFNLIYYNAYFICRHFAGIPCVAEPEKCSEIKWFDIDNLPDDLMDDRKQALTAYRNGEHYVEYGWK